MALSPWEPLLDRYSSAALTAMVKERGIPGGKGKSAAIAALSAALEDPTSVRSAYQALERPAQALLALLRAMGGTTTIRQLRTAGKRAGIAEFDPAFRQLVRAALVLYVTPGYSVHELWSGPRSSGHYGRQENLAWEIVGPPAALEVADLEVRLPPLVVQRWEGEPATVEESPPARLVQALWSLLRWAERRNVRLTKSLGFFSKTDVRSLAKELGGDENWAAFVASLALTSELLVPVGEGAVPSPGLRDFFQQPVPVQLGCLTAAWVACDTWNEFGNIPGIECDPQSLYREDGYSDVPAGDVLTSARALIVGVLSRAAADPAELEGWHSLASFAGAVREVDDEFVIPQRRRYWSQEEAYSGIWRAGNTRWGGGALKKKEDWDLVEGGYLRQVFAEPLLWLGIVTLGRDGAGEPVAYRVTALGARVLGAETAPLPEAEAEEEERKRLIVQPNFEVLAYAETEDLAILFELERFAERVSADRVATYRVSRESVYRGFQDGLCAAGIQEFLDRFSRTGVPQNVAYSLDDWQRRYDQVRIVRDAALVEAESAAALDDVIARLPEGSAERVTPTWAWLRGGDPAVVLAALAGTRGAAAYNYSLPVANVLTVRAGGGDGIEVRLPLKDLDLRLGAALERFAAAGGVEKGQAVYRVNRKSLSGGEAAGPRGEAAFRFLAAHAKPPIPADVELTLRGWSGEVGPIAVEDLRALVMTPEALALVLQVEELRERICFAPCPEIALVRPEEVAPLLEALARRGIKDGGRATLRNKPPAAPRRPPTAPGVPATRRVDLQAAARFASRSQRAPAELAHSAVALERGLSERSLERRLDLALDEAMRVVLEVETSPGKTTLVKVDPLAVEGRRGRSVLHAYSHASGEIAAFPFSSIRGIAVLDEEFDTDDYDDWLDAAMPAAGP